MGSPPQSAEAPPAQRNFQRKFALRQVGSARFVVPPTIERSKVRNNARLGKSLYRAAPGCQRDRGPFCFGKSPEEPLSRGSFGQLLRGGSTPRFFSQIRSVGSKPSGWQGTASQPLVPGPRVQPTPLPLPRSAAKKAPLRPAGRKKGPASRQVLSYFRITLRLHQRARAARGWTARYACAPDRCR